VGEIDLVDVVLGKIEMGEELTVGDIDVDE
jgi:hypothetical protein